jgi:hypothetical protein
MLVCNVTNARIVSRLAQLAHGRVHMSRIIPGPEILNQPAAGPGTLFRGSFPIQWTWWRTWCRRGLHQLGLQTSSLEKLSLSSNLMPGFGLASFVHDADTQPILSYSFRRDSPLPPCALSMTRLERRYGPHRLAGSPPSIRCRGDTPGVLAVC